MSCSRSLYVIALWIHLSFLARSCIVMRCLSLRPFGLWAFSIVCLRHHVLDRSKQVSRLSVRCWLAANCRGRSWGISFCLITYLTKLSLHSNSACLSVFVVFAFCGCSVPCRLNRFSVQGVLTTNSYIAGLLKNIPLTICRALLTSRCWGALGFLFVPSLALLPLSGEKVNHKKNIHMYVQYVDVAYV